MKNKVKEKNNRKELPKLKSYTAFIRKGAVRGVETCKKIGEAAFSKYSDMLCEELQRESAGRKVRVSLFISSIFLCVLAFFLSCTEFTNACYPLSVAILSATGVRGEDKSPFTPKLIMALSMGAVMLSCLFMGNAGVLYFATLITLFILRCVMTHGDFNENGTYRTLSSFFTALILGFMGALVSDFALLSLVAWVTLITLCPIFTYLFSSLFDMLSKASEDTKGREKEEIALLSVAFCTVFALSQVTFLSLSVSALTAFFITMCVSKKHGAVKGGVVGLVLGSACCDAVFAASFGLSGLFAGLFFTSDLTMLLVSVLTTTVVSVYLGGTTGFLEVMPETMAGFLVLWPVLLKTEASREGIVQVFPSQNSYRSSRAREKLEKMSGTFSSLSEVFFAVSEGQRVPSGESVRAIVENSCNSVCASCSLSHKCWGREWRDTNGIITSLADRVVKKGKLEPEDFPEYFLSRCPKSREICEGVNSRSRLALFGKSSLDSANLIAGEYRTVSKLLKNTAELFSRFPEEDVELSRRAERALKSLDIDYGFVESWGGRCSVVDVVGVCPEKMSVSSLDVVSAFENECGILFDQPEFITGGDRAVMRICRRRALQLECAKNTCGKKGETVNGDSVVFFESDEGHFYALIADGMGSGREAALTSRLASVFLEKLLTCTSDKSTILEMLNRMLVSKEGECFTTLDLVEIDLFEKCATFIKAGASPSYIVRGDRVYIINSATPPAGIIDEFSAEQTRTHLKSGDIVVLVSDGVTGDGETLITDELFKKEGGSAFEISRRILSSALSRFDARDDMSVVVIKVFED